VSAWMFALQLTGNEFLAFDFQVTVVYLPTLVAGIIATYLTFKTKPSS
jgi:hypothetical protein